MTQTGEKTYGTAEEWTLLIRRVKAIPAFLQRRQVQIEAGVKAGRVADGRMIDRDGLRQSRPTPSTSRETLPALAERSGSPVPTASG